MFNHSDQADVCQSGQNQTSPTHHHPNKKRPRPDGCGRLKNRCEEGRLFFCAAFCIAFCCVFAFGAIFCVIFVLVV